VVNGRLRCLGSNQHLKLRYGNGFEVNIKTMTADDQTIDAFINSLLQRFQISHEAPVSFYLDLCNALSKPYRRQCLESTLEVVSVHLFAEWWLAEDQAEALDSFFDKHFKAHGLGCHLIERNSRHSYRYQLSLSSESSVAELPSMRTLFTLFEENKAMLEISEYSISQTTLEQIFNQIAQSSDNPEVAAAEVINPLVDSIAIDEYSRHSIGESRHGLLASDKSTGSINSTATV
jgi:ATP-binding cassette, subfamily A (ABC1), member 3